VFFQQPSAKACRDPSTSSPASIDAGLAIPDPVRCQELVDDRTLIRIQPSNR
jgi:hypothetical protein